MSTEATPAATVVLLRAGHDGLETLMLRRNAELHFGGMWVFPGGVVDPDDVEPGRPDDELAAARRAAARETLEEAGLVLEPAGLVTWARWCPPPEAPKRFNTWFFVAEAPHGAVEIDGGEIHDHLWIHPGHALERHARKEIDFGPPTWVTLHQLSAFPTPGAALAAAAGATPRFYFSRRGRTAEGAPVTMWDGDAGYETGDPTASGPRHRLSMHRSGWIYETP
ncbi:MAG: NUDIX hydrolase [Acidimicrobiales bacterium]